jgi:hypothetical protein
MKLFGLVALAGSLFAASAAHAETPPPTTPAGAGTVTTTVTPFPVPDPAALRDDLLTVAFANLNQIAAPGFLGFFPAWSAKYPGLDGSGYAIVSVPGRISIWWNRPESKAPVSDSNPELIAFAVAGSNGGCAGGALYGNPKISKTAKVTVSGPCTAQQVVQDFVKQLTATAPASVSPAASVTAAPAPPATGNSASQSDQWGPLAAEAAAMLLVAGAALVLVSRKRRA